MNRTGRKEKDSPEKPWKEQCRNNQAIEKQSDGRARGACPPLIRAWCAVSTHSRSYKQ